MLKKPLHFLLRWSARLLVAIFAVTAVFAVYAIRKWDAVVDAPRPPIHADRTPAAVARGQAIFRSTCEICHRDSGSERAAGAPDHDAPAFLGTFYAPNLTSDPIHGIGAVADEEIARVIRYGVTRTGHRTVMPNYGMGDSDIAALLGFLRSDDLLFRPDPRPSPPSQLTAVGKLVIVASGGASTVRRPAQGVPVPEKTDSVVYGRYLAHEVLDCVGCHTPGYSASKASRPDAFSGGFEFTDPSGRPVTSKNLTPDDATGLAHYTRDDLSRALREGKRPDGTALSAPMPVFRALDDVDVAALLTYLRSLPPQRNDGAGRTPPALAAR